MERIAPSVRLEAQIDELLSGGLGDDGEHLAELGRLGARLVLQRAVEEEVTAFLGRARYARTPTGTGSRNGTRPKAIQTAEGEITIAMPRCATPLSSSSAGSSRTQRPSSAPDLWRPSSSAATCAVCRIAILKV